ncbi:MAG: hypothetical protein QOK37_161 [Thermoanaerobaculia bacterium]|jgi:hypothetical protein|nr:hypothetical protein [Thermoanaerobaculia bacterium]
MAESKFGPIVGCWQMVEAYDINDPGLPGKSYPWGNPPLGYWVYDSAGNVSVQISINPPLPAVNIATSSWWMLGSNSINEAILASFNNYMAYFGTYTVEYNADQTAGTVTAQVTTDVLRQYTGTSQPRPFTLQGDTLTIGDPTSYIRIFKRVAPA